jgi:hypothetical protein
MARIHEEGFGALAAGTALTTSNTSYTSITTGSGGSATAVSDGVQGSAGRITVGAASTTARFSESHTARGEMWARFYFRVGSYPPSTKTIADIKDNAAGSRAELRIDATGRVVLRNQSTAVDTSIASVPTNVWNRVDWWWDQSGGGTQEARLFLDGNRHGAIDAYDEALVGAASGGTSDEMSKGILTGTANWSIEFDDDAIDDADWCGPSLVVPPTQFGEALLDLEALLVEVYGLDQYTAYWSGAGKVALVEFIRDVGPDQFHAGERTLRRGDSEVWSPSWCRPVYDVDRTAYTYLEGRDLTI